MTPRLRIRLILSLAALMALALVPAMAVAQDQFTEDFDIERCKFEPNGRQNPYFSLNPGDQITLEGEDDGEELEVEITVSDQTKTITFKPPGGKTMTIQARVVVERETVDGELVEVSRNWFSRCRQTHDVFYFGEEVDIYENGQIVSHEGAWEAGKNGSQPGIIIPARFLLGSRYYQELAPAGEALDRAEHTDMNFTVRAAGRTFRDCVEVIETSPLEPGHESLKVYCPGVGLVRDNEAVLTELKRD
jgi:hypothetical protein